MKSLNSKREDKIAMGSVVAPGPVTKLAITTSSSERVNDKSHAAASAENISGIVIKINVFKGPAPKSIAASSSVLSISCNLEEMITAEYEVQKVTCASHTVKEPLVSGHPVAWFRKTNINSRETPRITSGMTKGAVTILLKKAFPRNDR